MVVPAGVAAAAADGLRLVAAGYAGRGLTTGAVMRARVLARGGPVSRETVRKMRNWFRRHHVDRRPNWAGIKTPGWVAWQLWGGSAGWRWTERLEGGDWVLPRWAMSSRGA